MNELLITTNISLLYEPGSGGGLRPPQDMYIYPHAEPQPTSLSLMSEDTVIQARDLANTQMHSYN